MLLVQRLGHKDRECTGQNRVDSSLRAKELVP